MQDRHFSDEELVAFLDGEYDFTPHDAIKDALKSDAQLAQRLDALRLDMAALQDSFDLLEAPAVPPLISVAAKRRPNARAPLAIAASVALAVGVGIGAWLAAPKQPGWVDYVAAYQALYTNATLGHINQSPADLTSELERVSAAIGADLTVEQLSAIEGATYKRAQVLSFQGKPLIQLAFATPTGVPIALCIIRSGESSDVAALDTMRLEGMSSATWAQNGYKYLLIGGTEDGLIARLGEHFQSMEI